MAADNGPVIGGTVDLRLPRCIPAVGARGVEEFESEDAAGTTVADLVDNAAIAGAENGELFEVVEPVLGAVERGRASRSLRKRRRR